MKFAKIVNNVSVNQTNKFVGNGQSFLMFKYLTGINCYIFVRFYEITF